MQDRNFDAVAPRFQKKIYDSMKGKLRLFMLKQDLGSHVASRPPLRILDAGSGLGQISRWAAEFGHRVTQCDISGELLREAEKKAMAENLSGNMTFRHCAIQDLEDPEGFDLVMCHAVLEWTEDPDAVLAHLLSLVRPGGIFSLMFYNRNGLIMKHGVSGNVRKLLNEDFSSGKKRFTPIHLHTLEYILDQLRISGLSVIDTTGIRVFSDYMDPDAARHHGEAALLALEQKYCKAPPFLNIARYIHVLCRKPD